MKPTPPPIPLTKRSMIRGDTKRWDLALTNPQNGAPLNLTGATLWFTAKYAWANQDNTAAIALDTVSGGVVIDDIARGLAHVQIEPIKTRAFPDGPVVLVYDVQVKDGAGNLTTVERGELTIWPDATRAIT